MSKKTKRAFEDYEEIALYIRTAIQLLNKVVIVYRRAKLPGNISKIQWELEKIKSRLEDEMYEDYPERANTNVFYGCGKYSLDLKTSKEGVYSTFKEESKVAPMQQKGEKHVQRKDN